MKDKNAKTFQEAYIVKFNYQKDDGYWIQSAQEEVYVTVEHGKNEKRNHSVAEQIIKTKYPNCQIISITYV